eukprot:2511178-Ditylum_brightwellii.AAC.1
MTASGVVIGMKVWHAGAMAEALVYSGHLGSATETGFNWNQVPYRNDAVHSGFFEKNPSSVGVVPTMVMECVAFLEGCGCE